jgi:hypothetical protein
MIKLLYFRILKSTRKSVADLSARGNKVRLYPNGLRCRTGFPTFSYEFRRKSNFHTQGPLFERGSVIPGLGQWESMVVEYSCASITLVDSNLCRVSSDLSDLRPAIWLKPGGSRLLRADLGTVSSQDCVSSGSAP